MALASPSVPVRIAGIDPRLVFKISADSRLTDDSLQSKGLQHLGESSGWDYFVLPHDENATSFRSALEAYRSSEHGKSFFRLIKDIEPYGPEDRRGTGLEPDQTLTFPLLVDIHLWPASSGPEARERLTPVRALLRDQELGADEQPAFLLVRASVDEATLGGLLALPAVERIRVPPSPYLSPTDWIGPSALDEVEQPPSRTGVVGVIDDGVLAGHPLLDGLVDSFEVPAGRAWAPPTQHGTMVAGLAAYGDFESALRDGAPLPSPIQVVAARVVEDSAGSGSATFPAATPEHRVLESAIREIVRRGAQVVNISLADGSRYAGPHVDQRTEMLDRLARELDLVIVTASGNVSESVLPAVAQLHAGHPGHLLGDECRVAEPAIAANCLTVGSVARSGQGAHPDGDTPPHLRAVASANQVSPFSRSGPGFRTKGSIKPDLVHYGGNLVSQAMLSQRTLSHSNVGVAAVSLGFPDLFHASSGTSFAAPRVARIAAVVRAEYPEASANLTRALVGLSARTPDPHMTKSGAKAAEVAEHLRLVGFGRPDQQRAVESLQHRVVMTFDGDITTNTSVIHPIPVPEQFAIGKSDRSIAIALAYDPPTRRFRREYLASRMRVDLYRAFDLGELSAIMARQLSKGKKLSLPKDRRRVQHLKPSSEAVLHSTLQVRRWRASDARSLDPNDGETYYLVVTHISEPWAERAEPDYEQQRYALAVELEDRGRRQINILERVRARLRAVV